MSSWQWATRLAVLVVLGGAIYFAIVELPLIQTATTGPEHERQLQLQTDLRRTYAQIIGGAALLLGLYFTWRSVRTAEEGQVTNLFVRAVEQLASPETAIRAGGIYSLERIGMKSADDGAAIAQLLCAFVRSRIRTEEESSRWTPILLGDKADQEENLLQSALETLPWTPPAPSDLQAALGALLRLRRRWKANRIELDLHGADLRRVDLRTADLTGADLSNARLDRANLSGATLAGATLWHVTFERARLHRANLRETDAPVSDFSHADLTRANLTGFGAKQTPTPQPGDLEEDEDEFAILDELPDSIVATTFDDAIFEGAVLRRANLANVSLNGADLSRAVGITAAQVAEALGDHKTKLPSHVPRPEEWLRSNSQ